MKKTLMLFSILSMAISITACGGSSDEESRWSEPKPVLEGCDKGVMINSKQCQGNLNNQQLLIQIDHN